MPEIDNLNVADKKWLIEHDYYRFVRIGNNFYFSEDMRAFHSQIAIENGVTEFNSSNKPIVDDGGYLYINCNKLLFINITNSCEVKDRSTAREETMRIAKEKFGEENIY